MEPLSNGSTESLRKLQFIFTDIDDTLTYDGILCSEAFVAIEQLTRLGLVVVPVTGRPAGWCDHIARMWPIAGVIGENGAFAFAYDRNKRQMHRFFAETEDVRSLHRQKLSVLQKKILSEVPRARVASDQHYRTSDLAIDFAEDLEEALTDKEITRIVDLFEEAGATAKISSIHVNGWFGSFTKLTMIRQFSAKYLGVDLENARTLAQATYVGDSPNDEPAFAFFEHSVGVANIIDAIDRIVHRPKYLTQMKGGFGFAEFAEHILAAKNDQQGVL